MTEVFGWLSAFFVFAAAIQYIFKIIWGKTKPERGATLIWLTTNTVIFLSSRADGAADSLWLPFGDMVVGIIMFFLAIKYGYKWLAKRDVVPNCRWHRGGGLGWYRPAISCFVI